MTSPLVRVKGAELVDGRLVFGGASPPGGLSWATKAWRFIGPAPITILPGERFVLAKRQHWCVPLKTMAHSGVAWPVALTVSWLLDVGANGFWPLKVLVWLGAVVHQMMACYAVLEWRAHLLVVTSHRMLQVEGVFHTGLVDVLLAEVRKFTVHQGPLQWLLGYGTLRLEIAGDHDVGAKREFIRFVPDPGAVHRAARMACFQTEW